MFNEANLSEDYPSNISEPVIGPDGEVLTLDSLPAADTKRWVIRRKAIVVAAVHGGLISLEAACECYALSKEEFKSWETAIERHGLAGLRTTRIQTYRKMAS